MKTQTNQLLVRSSLCLVVLLLVGLWGSLLAGDLDPILKAKWPGHRLGPARAVAVAGNYAYVAAEELLVIDISDPANPHLAGYYDTTGAPTGVAVSGHYAYWAASPGLQVIDISNPADPQPVGDAKIVNGSVAVSGSYAYLTR